MKKLLFTLLATAACVVSVGWAQDALLRSGDSFDLRISGVPSDDQGVISANYTIDGSGFFSLAYIGKVRAAGRTASDVQTSVERAYMDQGIFTHPTVTLNIAAGARFINIGGPGMNGGGKRLPYTSDLTILSAITAAGDFNEFANQRKVHLIRGGKATIVDCKKLRADPSKDFPVLPGDNIQVEETIF